MKSLSQAIEEANRKKKCHNCASTRLLELYASAGEIFCNYKGQEDISGLDAIQDGSDINFVICLDCGQVQGEWPQPTPEEFED